MEYVNCDLCGASETTLLFEEKDRLHKIPGTFHLVRCNQCGLIYLNPRPTKEEMKRYYPAEYRPYVRAINDENSLLVRLDRLYGINKRCRAIVTRVGESGRLLDIGCATGNFLDGMRRHGHWDLHGVEVNQEAAMYARQRLGLNVFIGEVNQAAFPDRYFDVVTLWDVLEHLHEPTRTLLEVRRITKPGGLLVISLPNADSFDARLFGRYWAGLDAPRHLFVFSPAILKKFLHRTGFSITEIKTFTGGYHPFALSLQFWLDEKVQDGRAKHLLLKCINSMVPRLLLLPYFVLANRLNKTSIMTVFARPQE